MLERFKYYSPSQVIKDNKTGQRYYGNKPLAKLLNELYEDNQMLNRLVEKRDGWNNLAHERIFELEEENESLKDVNAQCCNDYSAMRRDVLRYKKENEQLKEEKEKWKSNCSLVVNENSILWNEISILREQGAEPSEAFNDYLNKKRGDLND